MNMALLWLLWAPLFVALTGLSLLPNPCWLSLSLSSCEPWALSQRPIIIMAQAAARNMMMPDPSSPALASHLNLSPMCPIGRWAFPRGACMPTSLKWFILYPSHNLFCCLSLSSSHLKESGHGASTPPSSVFLSWFSNLRLIALFTEPLALFLLILCLYHLNHLLLSLAPVSLCFSTLCTPVPDNPSWSACLTSITLFCHPNVLEIIDISKIKSKLLCWTSKALSSLALCSLFLSHLNSFVVIVVVLLRTNLIGISSGVA